VSGSTIDLEDEIHTLFLAPIDFSSVLPSFLGHFLEILMRGHLLLLPMFLPVLLSHALHAQQVLQVDPGSPILKGFVKGLSGEHIDYHSFHPYATAALLTRCLDGKHVIEWQTEPIPTDYTGEYATFAWIAGHSTGTSAADRKFFVSINGNHWFTFTTIKERRVWQWTVEGRSGARLSFDGKWEDTVNDLFGYVYLRVPVRDFPKGQPLTVSIVGDSANSRDWYMTFKYEMRESVTVKPQPAIVLRSDGERQLIDVLIDHVEPGGSVKISTPGEPPLKADLKLGYNRMEFAVNAVREPKEVEVGIAVEGRPMEREVIRLHPVRYREFWLLPHSHNDIGYSDLQADVEKKQLDNLREAMRLWRKTKAYPPEARFKWNTEILWAVDRFLSTCDKAERREFIDIVKQGGIGLNALYSNQLTGLCRPEELLRLTDFARYLIGTYGVTIRDAMITDIPGFTWATVPALAHGGIRYFSCGPNFIPSFPDGGDRVGHFNRAWGDRPFYWVSPSGMEKVLFWVAGKGYSWFHGWISGKAGANTAWNLFEYARELEAKEYPYDMVQLRYTIVADNGPTDPDLPDFVKKWNEKYVTPKLVISTNLAMFQEFERRWGNTLPSFAGEITPYWEDGAISTLRELGMVREASERLVQAEAAACIGEPLTLDRLMLQGAWRNVHLFDEHTWGAWNSVSDPDNPFAVSQWRVKEQYARDADRQSKDLLSSVLASATSGDVIDVINTASWKRTDLVLLSREQSITGDRVTDADGNVVSSQRLSTGELALLATDVPPLGGKRYFITAGKAPEDRGVQVHGTELRSSLLALAADPETGAIRSLKTFKGTEFVDASVLCGLNQYFYVPGKNPAEARHNRVTAIEIKERGPLVGTLRFTSEAPGCKSLVQEIRLVDGLARVDVLDTIDKSKVRDKESVHFGFPVQVPGGTFRLDGGWGIVRPGADQLPGSCVDFFSAGRWLDVSNQSVGVTWVTRESPLVEIGAMTDESPNEKGYRVWRTSLAPGIAFYSYAMNNYWHTNYAADQAGLAYLHYGLYPHGIFRADEAYRAGVDQNQPLLVRVGSSKRAVPETLFKLSSPEIVVTSLRRSDDGRALMIRLYNAGGRPERFSVEWNSIKPRKVFISSLLETQDEPATASLSLPAYGILTLRCELK